MMDLMDELGVFLIGLGFFLTFFGSKQPSATLFFAGMCAATILSLVKYSFVILKAILYGLILPSFTPDWGHMLAFFFCIVIGIMAGGLSAMWTKVGIFLLGGWLGGTVGMMTYDAVFA
jgi:hypothetical protein